MNKVFPLTLHIILATVAIGLAVGATTEHVRPLLQYPINGLAVGTAVTAVGRIVCNWLA